MKKMYSYMYIVALCVCLLQICQLTCVPLEEAGRVLQAYTAIKHQLIYIPSSTCCTHNGFIFDFNIVRIT